MASVIYGFVSGLVIAIAGTSVTEDFWKFLVLAIVLSVTHHLTME